jgi:hypothetical protein
MFSIINKTRKVVLCRFNSGIELNLGPLEATERADSEVRENRDLDKLVRLGVIEKKPVKATGSAATPARSPAARAPGKAGAVRRRRTTK